MPEKVTGGTGRTLQTRYEDLAGVLMAVSVVARRLARKILVISQKAGEGGKGDDKE